jgi:hypothetical protein
MKIGGVSWTQNDADMQMLKMIKFASILRILIHSRTKSVVVKTNCSSHDVSLEL